MPGPRHQALVAVFETVPELLLATLRHDPRAAPLLPASPPSIEVVPDTTVLAPVELRADRVFILSTPQRRVAVILEVQQRPDPAKPLAWLNYAAAALRQFEADNAVVLVITSNEATARWASRQSVALSDATFTPHVMGPDALSTITAESPTVALALDAVELATRRRRPDPMAVADYLERLRDLDQTTSRAYAELALARLSLDEQHEVKTIMTTRTKPRTILDEELERGREEGLEAGREEGREEGRREGARRQAEQLLAAARPLLPERVMRELEALDDPGTLTKRVVAAIAEHARHANPG